MKSYFLFALVLLKLELLSSHAASTCPSFIVPKGFSSDGDYTSYLEGGSTPYLVYNIQDFNIVVQDTLPYANQISYRELLLSGIKSMLFEYKNYKGQDNLTAYSVFALGNYTVITPELLTVLNELVFPNQGFLKSIYEWAKPYYEKVFEVLTYEEQAVLVQKIKLADKYVTYVLEEKNLQKYKDWLIINGVEEDIKITGFVQRRVDKGQWTVSDCRFWVNEIKRDFLPRFKSVNEIASKPG